MVSSKFWVFLDSGNEDQEFIFLLENYFEGNNTRKEKSRQVSTDSASEDEEGDKEIKDYQNKTQAKMTDAAVSFVLGDPDPMEELETEDSFPDSEANDRVQQQQILPGLVERRKRLR